MKKEMTFTQLIAGYLVLCALLAAAVAVPFLHLQAASTVASFAIALLKMLVIVTVFMRLFYGSRLYALGFALGFIFLALLVLGTTIDLLARPLT